MWNDLTIKGNDLAWNYLTMERSDQIPCHMLNLMQTGGDPLKLTEFKEESIALRVLGFLLVSRNRMWKPWEWDAKEHKNMPNPSKILGHLWDKEDTRVFCKSFPWKSSCDQTNYSKLLWSRIWSTWNWQKENMSIDKPVMRRGHWNAVFSRHLGDHVAHLGKANKNCTDAKTRRYVSNWRDARCGSPSLSLWRCQ